jgi:hypothetical protein
MTKISFAGLLLGLMMAPLIATLSGSWIFWLAMGMSLGVLLGSAGARHAQRTHMDHGGSL